MHNHSELKKILIFYLVFLSSILLGLRNELGSDWEIYKDAYNISYDLGNYYNFEYLYFISNYLSNLLGIHYNFYLMLIALFFNYSLYYSYKYLHNNFILFFLIIFYSILIDNIGLNRQIIALSFLFIAHRMFLNDNFKGFFITSLIASLFHISSLIGTIGYFVTIIKTKKQFMVTIIIWSVFLILLNSLITENISSEIETISKITQYSNNSFGFLDEGIELVIVKRLILLSLAVFPLFRNYKYNDEYSLCAKLSIFGFVFFISFMKIIPIIATRGTFFFTITGVSCIVYYTRYSKIYLITITSYLLLSVFSSFAVFKSYLSNLIS